MKKLILTLTVALFATVSYAQKDIPAGASMELASTESGDDQMYVYKVKDKEGNPQFLLSASHLSASFDISTADSSAGFGIGDGTIVVIGETYEAALKNIEDLIALFDEADGAQMEFTNMDGSPAVFTLHKGFLGKHLSIGEASISKSDLKSLRTGLKISKKLHSQL